MGRPVGGIMTQAEKTHVCEQIADGRSLTAIVDDEEIAVEIRTIYRELNRDPFFLAEYSRAREASIEIKLSEMEDIIVGRGEWADLPVDRMKELINDRRWHAIRLQRFRYGDKIDVQATVKQVEGKVIDAKALDVDQLLAIRQALQIAAGGGDGYEEDEDYEYEGQDDSGEDEGLAED
jgi:hypothetical protein